MKRLLVFGLSLGLVAALAVPAAAGNSWRLYADEDVPIGTVTVTPSPENDDGYVLDLAVWLKDPWCMTQLHADEGVTVAGIPTNNKGNPQIGQFEVNKTFDTCKDTASFSLKGDGPVIAVHLDVWDESSKTTKTIVSGPGVPIVGGGNAVAANEPFNYPKCSDYKPGDATKSVWDNGIGAAYTAFNSAGADWIWDAVNPADPIRGNVVEFKHEFNIGWPTGGGKLLITADNAYRAWLNGGLVGDAQIGPGFPGTLMETVNGTPQSGNWGVASQGWQTAETYALNGFTAGDNVLKVKAANEYMWDRAGYNGPDYYYPGYDPVSGNKTPDLFPGTGIGGTNEGDNICRNPGALIYKLSVDHYSRGETAWAGRTPITEGGSWATYFNYVAPVDIP